MEKIKVSCVSYLNSRPFIYGLQHSDVINEIALQLDTPAVCAEKVEDGLVDIGLAPVAILPEMEEYHIISDYCIGSDGEVGSVLLLSQVPLNEIETIVLDYQSRTSATLARVLAEKYWHIRVHFADAAPGFESSISGTTAGVVIGDRAFSLKDNFHHVLDLSAEWKKFTQLPFAFACWVSNKELDRGFTRRFNEALRFGLMNCGVVADEYRNEDIPGFDTLDYLEKKISYAFDEKKKFAMELFLKYTEELMEADLMKIV